MCGIVGFSGGLDRRVLERMTALVAHRGPDDSGCHFVPAHDARPAVGLGHRRLSIIDLDTGHQPLFSADGSRVIVFNGEIYNYRQLRSELAARGHRFTTQSDTEVILAGYAEWGTAVPQHLEGMFAFAIHDQRDGEWFLARDRCGIKPLYYCAIGDDAFAFASEIKPLLAVRPDRRLDLRALYHFLLLGWGPVDDTIFRGIRQLPPAHCMQYRAGDGVRLRRYWQLPASEPAAGSPDEWGARIRDVLGAAVESHLVADVPVGITLSGGLDSSAVLALMAERVEPQRIRAFTVGYGRPDDEIPYARLAAAHLGVHSQVHTEPLARVAVDFPRMLWHVEEPLPHPVLGTTWYLARFVREHLKVILVGEGSDELFAGYPHYRLMGFPYVLAPAALRRGVFLRAAYLLPSAREWAGLLEPDWLDRDLLESVEQAYRRTLAREPGGAGALRMELEHELVSNQLLRIDKLMMAHSVEARVPFLDRQFVETAWSIPFGLKHRHGREKHVLRDAFAGLLPPQVANRPKSGPRGTQALLSALTDHVLADRVRAGVDPDRLRRRGWFRPQAVQDYLAAGRHWTVRRHPIASRTRAKLRLLLATLETWAELYLDRPDPCVAP